MRAVAALASAKKSPLKRRRAGGGGGLLGSPLDEGGARGSSEGGTETNAPKSDSVELAGLIEDTLERALGGGEKIDGDPNGRDEAGGVAGAKRVAKRSSTCGFTGRGEIAVPLAAEGGEDMDE